MILGFSTTFPDGRPTMFEQKILLPHDPSLQFEYPDLYPKIHTFRMGDRWRAGMTIHMATGTRSPQYRQFNAGIPGLEHCRSTQRCIITCLHNPKPGIRIEIDGRSVEMHYRRATFRRHGRQCGVMRSF